MAKIREKHIEAELAKLVSNLFEGEGINLNESDSVKYADRLLNQTENIIKAFLENGDTVVWTGFLKLTPSILKEREAYNPIKKEKYILPERKTVKAVISPSFRDKLNA